MKECGIARLCSRLAHPRLLVCCLGFFFFLYCQEKVNKQNKTKTKETSAVSKDAHPKPSPQPGRTAPASTSTCQAPTGLKSSCGQGEKCAFYFSCNIYL